MARTQKMTEVMVVISPFSGEDPTIYRVTIREDQLQDVLKYGSYGDAVFTSFKHEACMALELDAANCNIGLLGPETARTCTKKLGLYTGDVSDGRLLLH